MSLLHPIERSTASAFCQCRSGCDSLLELRPRVGRALLCQQNPALCVQRNRVSWRIACAGVASTVVMLRVVAVASLAGEAVPGELLAA